MSGASAYLVLPFWILLSTRLPLRLPLCRHVLPVKDLVQDARHQLGLLPDPVPREQLVLVEGVARMW